MADTPSRSRKRAKPSFDAPADVTSAPESGWVFRSHGPEDTTAQVEPAPVTTPSYVPPPSRAIAAEPPAAQASVADAPAVSLASVPPVETPAAPHGPVVMAPIVESESPLRFAWVPLAIGYSTILAMLPRTRRGGGDS